MVVPQSQLPDSQSGLVYNPTRSYNSSTALFKAGLACFLIGLLVSAIKAGWTRKFTSGIGKLKLEFRDAFPLQEHQEQIVSTEL